MRSLQNIEAFILVGGASSRMGTDKAVLKLNGETFVERIAKNVSVVARKTTLIGSNENLAGYKFPIAGDVFNSWGALGGLHAALSACKSDWALVVACDLPLVSKELFLRMASLREGWDAVAPIQQDGRPQPLCALYRVAPCLDCAERLIASGERRPRVLLRAVRTRWVTTTELEDLESADLLFLNVNTPTDYQLAVENLKGEKRERTEVLSNLLRRTK
jgi:molybdopterin-guanine dinucleotide biosynthesis protein A